MADRVTQAMWNAYARAHFGLEGTIMTELEEAGMEAARQAFIETTQPYLAARLRQSQNLLQEQRLRGELKAELSRVREAHDATIKRLTALREAVQFALERASLGHNDGWERLRKAIEQGVD